MMDPRNFADPAGSGSYRLVLRTEEDASGSSIECTAWFVDKGLRIRQFARMSLPLDGTWREPGGAPKADAAEPPIELSAESREHARALTRGAAGALRALVVAPDRRDPLDFTVAEACRELAKARKTSLVAWLPDRLLSDEAQLGEKPEIVAPRPSEWLGVLWVRSVDAIPTADSLVLRPRVLATNVDRKTLAILLQATDRAGYPSLDALSTYAASRDDAYVDDLCARSLDATVAGASSMIRSDWRALALWGTFSPAQRKALLEGQSVSWSRLLPPQRDRLTKAILRAPLNEIVGAPRLASGLFLDGEPTELLANGFASDGTVAGTGSIREAVMIRDPNEPRRYPAFVHAQDLAYAAYRREARPGEEPHDGLPNRLPESFVPGREIDFGFKMALAPNVTWGKTGRHAEFDLRASPSSLPTTFRTQYEAALDTIRRNSPKP